MVDRNIGKILRKVNDLGLGDDLLVLFTTDHGDLMFDHGCIEKTILYERSMRVPFVVSGPGVPSGESRPQFASHVDLLPTVLDCVGIPERRQWNIEGRSLLPVVRDAEEKGREYLYCESDQTLHLRHLVQSCQSKVVRHRDLKYIYNAGGRPSGVRGAVRSGRGPRGTGEPGSLRPTRSRAGTPSPGAAALADCHRAQSPASCS